jgi:hypothetical protein
VKNVLALHGPKTKNEAFNSTSEVYQLLANKSTRRNAVATACAIASKAGYDGISVEFEGPWTKLMVPPSDRSVHRARGQLMVSPSDRSAHRARGQLMVSPSDRCTFGPAKNMCFMSGEKYALLVRRKICTFGPTKNMHFWSGEKYALLGRRKICTFGPTKNMHLGSDEKYVLLVRRKICTFGPAKNMYFWSDEKYALGIRRKICALGPAKNMYFWSSEKYVPSIVDATEVQTQCRGAPTEFRHWSRGVCWRG